MSEMLTHTLVTLLFEQASLLAHITMCVCMTYVFGVHDKSHDLEIISTCIIQYCVIKLHVI